MSISEPDIERLDFGKGDGLLPVIVQHARFGEVLMLGYMNPEALRETLRRRRVVFWSRSKQRLWEKGETSGNHLAVLDVRADCDQDALLVVVEPAGPVCHLGTRSCFGDTGPSRAGGPGFLDELERVIEDRIARPGVDSGSYTARLFAAGPRRIAQKVGEEGVEVALAAVAQEPEALVAESADLLFHLIVLLRARGLRLDDVVAELARRHAARS